ncbi:hypothetical protein NIES4075_12250 [Tolypothrix sp. NIES-4075]|uniref:hypothetical protein n=1 Tax=Tolypothrix sp. NIES-4075 TaxID=2005459 RepID=UPI000B63DD8C|nr:hypothetical protein [Tolypothrix sp. NIES-4075]GAX40261.1 hypothetical protein NIES4075_12250 [Tolypothrix sp. NIES-4075]
MTQSVDQTSIKDVTSRRHNDPPGLWIAVVTSSVALHLLVFWLMRYNNAFGLWFPRDSQAIVPIEVIEISPSSSKAKPGKPAKPQLKAKTVSPPSANQQSSTVTARNENSGGINFGAIRKQRKRNTFASKPNTQLVPKKLVPTPKPIFTPTPTPTRTPTQKFTPTPTPTPIPTPTPKPTSFGNLPWKRFREEISLGKPTPLPKFTPVEPRQPIGEDSPTQSRRTPRQPIGEDSPTQSRRTPRQPIGEDSPTQSRRTPRQPIGEDSPTPTTPKTPQPPTGGTIIVSSRFLTPNELTPDEQRILNRDPLPEGLILPEHIGSNSKQIDSLSIKPNSDLPEKEFLATLVIDKAGNFVQAVVEDPAIAPAERGKYQQFANSIFQGEKFQPARSPNGTPVPELVNRFVRVKIQRR